MTAVLCAPVGLAVLILRIARLLEKEEEKKRQAVESRHALTELSNSNRRFADAHRLWHTDTAQPQMQESVLHAYQNEGNENYNAGTIAADPYENRCDRDLQMSEFPPSNDESVRVPHIRVEEPSPICDTGNIVFTIGD